MKKLLLISIVTLAISGCQLRNQDSAPAIGTAATIPQVSKKHTKKQLEPVYGPCIEYANNPGALAACKEGYEDRKRGAQILLETQAYEKGRGWPEPTIPRPQ